MAKKTLSAVATRIREEAKRQGLSQTALAGSCSMTQQAISRRLSGGAPITVTEAEQFAAALNVSISWLYGETPAAPAAELAGAGV